jgi:SAM-dependent methyltransferase
MSALRGSFAIRHNTHVCDSKHHNSGLKDYPQFLIDISFRQRASAIIKNLRLRGSEVVLDCGCGDGIFTSILEKKSTWTVGLDVSIHNLQIAKESTEGDVSLVLGDAQNLPFKSGQFDRVLCTEVLEHLQNDVKALKEIHRVLANNAFLVLTVPNKNYPFLWDPLNKILTNVLKSCPIKRGIFGGMWFAHQRLYDTAELERKLNAAALKLHHLEGLTHIFFPSHPLIWNLYVVLKHRLNILRPPKLFSWILNHMDKINSCMKKIEGSVSILLCASPQTR